MPVSNLKPKHTVARRQLINYQGDIQHLGVFVRSGSLDGVQGSTTGSIEMSFDAVALRLRRVEVFHSGAAQDFGVAITNQNPALSGTTDQRSIATCYDAVPGWNNGGVGSTPGQFDAGLDQIEDIIVLTDHTAGDVGNLYIKLSPEGTGQNYFRYLLFFEAVFLYESKDGGLNG
jgi:hypothetical protein